MSDDITIGPYEPGDGPAIIACFQKVFGVERTVEHWNWKFRDCPYGLHAFLGKTPSGQVVAQFTGIPSPHKVGEETFTFCQILDSMVDPDFRRGLKKPGVFASTVFDYVDHYGHRDREAIMYGLPNPQAFRIGRRLLGYSFIHDIVMLYKSADELRATPTAAPDGVSVDIVERFGPDADGLWAEFSKSVEVANIRDATWLDWRFSDCPDAEYLQLTARGADGTLRGVAVARPEYVGTQDAVLCDWVVPPADTEASLALLSKLEALALQANASGFLVLFPEYSPEFALIKERGYSTRESQFIQVARSYTDDVPLDLLKAKWWYTLGDYDLV